VKLNIRVRVHLLDKIQASHDEGDERLNQAFIVGVDFIAELVDSIITQAN